MKKNRLGQSDLFVSEIGLGCMSLGTEEAHAVRIIHEALDAGVNFLDTADLYDAGRNEELVGLAIRGRRSEVIVATKVGNRRIPGREGWVWDPSKAYIKQAVRDSLRRLGTDYIDLYQLHGGTIDDPIDETIEAFEELKREGLIRHYGISSIRPNVIREYARRSNIVSLMSQYSMLDRRPEEETLRLIEGRGISLIARGPLAGGILTEGGAAKAERDYLDYSREELPEVRRRLLELCGNGRTLVQTAIRYALADPAVATVIPGASSLEQLRLNLSAASAPPLAEEELAAIRAVTRANRYEQHR
ncbi:Aldo/keto reductase, Oxidoreductase, aldo/keto reductase family protein [Thermobacillus xylanilyticus]|uniref:Aldo/keto reductase, Oxidoreductase, aldo/keto reductase family protein n=1 Tax=Thermobacillus xylanilyticus TaxID=76633 RepID=A0ABN7RLH7_THEXY|nr:aldo/keto reductase [Thermobacillus xylanilyticus]REJ17947.1 MAG: oxidoreductase [Paenibacillaceae bacterium]CAG5080581.1 Aldo/keto reductase, Oxidoreductase, aldo/keto reductase family protein [Thermobacillus xylanilyticus]